MEASGTEALDALYYKWSTLSGGTLDDARKGMIEWRDLGKPPGNVQYSDDRIGGIPGIWSAPDGSDPNLVVLGLHGGGYMSGSSETHKWMFGHLARAAGAPVFTIDYRLGPEHKFPAALDDAVAAYQGLLDRGYPAHAIAVVGDSAGGGLAVSLLTALRDRKISLPSAFVSFSAWTDLAATGESLVTNKPTDHLVSQASVPRYAAMYLQDDWDRCDPLVSPVFGDFTGFCPMYFQVSASEGFLDDSRRIAAKAASQGVETVLDVYPGMPHVFQITAGNSKIADSAILQAGAWLALKLKGAAGASPT